MKNWILLLIIALGVSSCQKVVFEEPQPRFWPSVPAFPWSIQGSYPLMGEPGGIVVGKKSISLKDGKTFVLGENLVLKRYQGYWIVSLQEDSGSWDVYAVKDKKAIKTIQVQKSELHKINEVVGREVLKYDNAGKPLPLKIRRREFKKLLKEVFTGIEMN